MKRWLAVLLALVMVLSLFTLTACGEKEDDKSDEKQEEAGGKDEGADDKDDEKEPEKAGTADVINGAIRKTKALSGIDAKIVLTLMMGYGDDFGEEKAEATQVYNTKIENFASDDAITFSKISASAMTGEDAEMEIYTEDGMIYWMVDGENYKTEIDPRNGDDLYDTSVLLDAALQELPVTVLNEAATDSHADDSTSVKLIDDKLADSLGEIADLIAGMLGDSTMETTAVKVSNPSVNVRAGANGYLVSYGLCCDLQVSMTCEGVPMDDWNLEVDMEVIFNNPGEAVTVTAPEGYKDFPGIEIPGI